MLYTASDDGGKPPSKRLLDHLRAEAGKQRRDSLDRLEQACDSLSRAGTLIDAAKAGRECARLFKKGPDGQSIRNDQKGFRVYVVLRREEQEQHQADGRRRRRRSKLVDRIEAITDADLRAQLRLMMLENSDLKRRLGDIIVALAELAPGIDLDTLVQQRRAGGVIRVPVEGASRVDPSSLAALEGAIKALTSEDVLRAHGLAYDGRRLTRAKPPYTELLPAGLLPGLIALHASLSGPAACKRD